MRLADQIREVLRRAGTDRVTLGGITFWFEGDELKYDRPTKEWDIKRINLEIVIKLL